MRYSFLIFRWFYWFVAFCLLGVFPGRAQERNSREVRMEKAVVRQLDDLPDMFLGWHHLGVLGIDSVHLSRESHSICIYLTKEVSYMPVRGAWIEDLRKKVKNNLSSKYRSWLIEFRVFNRLLETYVPPGFRKDYLPDDTSRMVRHREGYPLVKREGQPSFEKGLGGRHIALWPSHGYYYECTLDRWEWQRARLFGTVEDLYPFSFIHNFLAPMLENAGANVLMPRERDIQSREVIVDNDRSTPGSVILTGGGGLNIDTADNGFALSDTLFEGDNPFRSGSFLRLTNRDKQPGKLVYIPRIAQTGEYALCVSWGRVPKASDRVEYVVRHSGGKTRFYVNQTMGFGTWVYLGTFHFVEGADVEKGSVSIIVPEDAGVVITADAVRLGGGMGNVARRPALEYAPKTGSLNEKVHPASDFCYKLSGKPRWMEGARYWLQYAGMPDTLVYNLNLGKKDYNDDYQSRGEWVNYLMGAPNGPSKAPGIPGLNIPVDLAFAFHTDAGITHTDSVIGTLGIYSSMRNEGFFPSGKSRLASRDLTDLVQSQIVSDIRLTANDNWIRRAMWDKEYSEAWRPNVPAMLLELLSHQNMADMKYGLDPRFKFMVARAIYKGMARFQAAREGRQAVIQPLAPDHMAIQHLNGRKIKVSWKPVTDSLESSAVPVQYKVFQCVEDNGFDEGKITSEPSLVIELPEYDTIYSFRVVAMNEGGQSLAGETLSVSLKEGDSDMALIVSGFDRVAPPAFVDGKVAGLARWKDEGVPWMKDVCFTGDQYDYDPSSPWIDDDCPGHGASYSDREGVVIPGNSFDFVRVHGHALRAAGVSFVSVSDEVFETPGFDATPFIAVDIIMGEEKATRPLAPEKKKDFRIWTPAMIHALGRYLEAGGNLFLSGAYVASEMIENNDSLAIEFAEKYLHFTWRTNYADNLGKVVVTDAMASLFPDSLFYNTSDLASLYKVEAPDGIEPCGKKARRIFRYAANNVSAGVAFAGNHRNIILGFPFESIVSDHQRELLMKQIIAYFENKHSEK